MAAGGQPSVTMPIKQGGICQIELEVMPGVKKRSLALGLENYLTPNRPFIKASA